MADRPTVVRDWPRGMREELAAEYLGVSASLLRRESEAGRGPKPVRVTAGRQVWLREDLDAWLDRLAGRPDGAQARALTPEAAWDAACGGTGEPALP